MKVEELTDYLTGNIKGEVYGDKVDGKFYLIGKAPTVQERLTVIEIPSFQEVTEWQRSGIKRQ